MTPACRHCGDTRVVTVAGHDGQQTRTCLACRPRAMPIALPLWADPRWRVLAATGGAAW